MKTSGTHMTKDATVALLTTELVQFLQANTPEGKTVRVASLSEKIIATLMDAGVIRGVRSTAAPDYLTAADKGFWWLKPATAGGGLPALQAEAELKVWDGGGFVDGPLSPEPTPTLSVVTQCPLKGTGTAGNPIALDVTGFVTGDMLVLEVAAGGNVRFKKLSCDPCASTGPASSGSCNGSGGSGTTGGTGIV